MPLRVFDTQITATASNGETYRITANASSQMKYVWVQSSNGSWWLSNSANRASIDETHHYTYQYYDCVLGRNEPTQSHIRNKIYLEGRFSSAETDAAVWFHNFTLSYDDLYNLTPLRNTIGDLYYSGKKNGQKTTTKVTPFYSYWPAGLL